MRYRGHVLDGRPDPDHTDFMAGEKLRDTEGVLFTHLDKHKERMKRSEEYDNFAVRTRLPKKYRRKATITKEIINEIQETALSRTVTPLSISLCHRPPFLRHFFAAMLRFNLALCFF